MLPGAGPGGEGLLLERYCMGSKGFMGPAGYGWGPPEQNTLDEIWALTFQHRSRINARSRAEMIFCK